MGTDTQLNKGVLEGCVLKLLERDFLFSGEIVGKMRASGFSDFSEGTLYPLLLRLEKDDCFEVKRVPSPNSPPKKYYKLSVAGRKRLNIFFRQWQDISTRIDTIFFGGNDHER